jgi:predicted dehydrogenase
LINAGIVGLGKMGLSHYAIVNSHPDVALLGVCDSSSFLLEALSQRTRTQSFYSDYRSMIEDKKLDCIIVSTPTVSHAAIVKYALQERY